MRAEPLPGLPQWGHADLEDLLEEARTFRRVGPASVTDPAALVRDVVTGLFGAGADQVGGRYALSPWLIPGWRSMALRRLRLHRTLIDVEVRPRADWVTVRLRARFGPAIPLALSLRNFGPVREVQVDDVALQAAAAVFMLTTEHEVMFFRSEYSPAEGPADG